MEIRSAEGGDAERVEDLVRGSFQTSYSLSPDQIDTIAGEVFGAEPLADRIGSDEYEIAVAEDDGLVVGVADVERGDPVVLRWLHVDPAVRGQGAGTELFEYARSLADEAGTFLTARVMAEDSEGGEFCEQFGFEQSETAELELETETFREHVYSTGGQEHDPNEPAVDVPETVTIDGEELPLDRDDEIPGAEAPFFSVLEADGEEPYGYFCSNCGSTEVAADGLDRLECQECGNAHRAEEWDGSYL